MEYELNHKEVNYQAEGKKIVGNKTILLHQAHDLTQATPWAAAGYTVTPLFEPTLFDEFKTQTKKLLLELWNEAGFAVPDDFELDQYHTHVQTHSQHLATIEKTKLIPTKKFPVPIALIEERIAALCGVPLVAKNPFDQQSVFHFRVIRPNSLDNNPLHRDVWLEDYANCINLYIPIAGSNLQSSLSLIAGSHHWSEDLIERTHEGAVINGIKFNVPAVTNIKTEYTITRPNPSENKVLVFSPYLIHGGAVNLNSNITRLSIELRLWKKN